MENKNNINYLKNLKLRLIAAGLAGGLVGCTLTSFNNKDIEDKQNTKEYFLVDRASIQCFSDQEYDNRYAIYEVKSKDYNYNDVIMEPNKSYSIINGYTFNLQEVGVKGEEGKLIITNDKDNYKYIIEKPLTYDDNMYLEAVSVSNKYYVSNKFETNSSNSINYNYKDKRDYKYSKISDPEEINGVLYLNNYFNEREIESIISSRYTNNIVLDRAYNNNYKHIMK